ncbi:hypothetical protein NL676_005114 [Syzygium grande]|nr:hypothetical protein NL676_005114 [Syzygium grande]
MKSGHGCVRCRVRSLACPISIASRDRLTNPPRRKNRSLRRRRRRRRLARGEESLLGEHASLRSDSIAGAEIDRADSSSRIPSRPLSCARSPEGVDRWRIRRMFATGRKRRRRRRRR